MGSALCNEMRKNIKLPSEGRAREKHIFSRSVFVEQMPHWQSGNIGL